MIQTTIKVVGFVTITSKNPIDPKMVITKLKVYPDENIDEIVETDIIYQETSNTVEIS